MHEILRILVREGVIGRDRAEELAAVSERDPLSAHPLEAWSEAGLDDIACAECLARVYELPHLDIARIERSARDVLGLRFIEEHFCLPIALLGEKEIIVAMIDPTAQKTLDVIRSRTGREPVPRVVSLTAFRRLAATNYNYLRVLKSSHERVFDQVFAEAVARNIDRFEVRDGLLTPPIENVPPTAGTALIALMRARTTVPDNMAASGGLGVTILDHGDALWVIDFAQDAVNAVIRRVTEEEWLEYFDELPAPVDE